MPLLYDREADQDYATLARIEEQLEARYYARQMSNDVEHVEFTSDLAAGFTQAVQEIDRQDLTRIARALKVIK